MKRRRITIVGAGIVLLAIVVVLVWPAKEAEPVVKGQPFSVWLRAVSKTPASGAIGEVAEAGTNAIPFLARAVRARNVIPYGFSVRIWRVLPVPLRLKLRPPVYATFVRVNALSALREFGPEAASALEVIIKAATKDTDAMSRAFALQAALAVNPNHPEVLALLKRELQSRDPIVRSSGLSAPRCHRCLPPRLDEPHSS